MNKFLLDTNCYDKLFENIDDFPLVKHLALKGKIFLLGTHLEQDEIEKISDSNYMNKLLELKFRLFDHNVATEGFVLEKSKLNEANLFPWDQLNDFMLMTKENEKNFEDILMARTASKHSAIFVTEDIQCREVLIEYSMKTFNYFEFIDFCKQVL